MLLTDQDIKRIAELSRIAVNEAEITDARAKLNSIFALIEKMQSVNTDGVEPMAHPQDVSLRLREDEVTEPNRRDDFLALAPQAQDGMFLVPKVIE